jgi:hypothetical protein
MAAPSLIKEVEETNSWKRELSTTDVSAQGAADKKTKGNYPRADFQRGKTYEPTKEI